MVAGMADYQKTVRPKYGGALQKTDHQWCTKNVATRLVAINGKGMIYGGTVWLDHTASQADAEVGMKLDGWFLASKSFLRMKDYGIVNPLSSVFTLNVYDAENYIYSVGLSYGITFESYLDLYYNETQGEDLTVHYDLVYTLI